MLRRVIENALVALTASAATWAATNPAGAARTAEGLAEGAVSHIASSAGALTDWLWFGAAALLATGVLLQVLSMAPRTKHGSWRWAFSMPSAASLMLGLGLVLGLTASALGLAVAGSVWALPLLATVVYGACRWAAGVRYRWSRLAAVL